MMIDFKYLFDKYNINCTGILHCGGNTGQERETYQVLGVPEVVWIEAIPDVFEELKNNLLPFPNQIAIKACVSDVDEQEVVFKISNNEKQSSSFLELGHHAVIHPEVHYVDTFTTKTTRLDTLFKWLERDISRLNFLNADLQGSELQCLKGMGELIKQFDYLYLEVNMKETYIGGALVGEIDEYVAQYNFERVETGQWVCSTWTDALYIKRK